MRDQSVLKAIRTILDEFGYPTYYYSLNEGYKEEAIGINKVNKGWIVCDFERGHQYDMVDFSEILPAAYVFIDRLALSEEQSACMCGMLEILTSQNESLESFKEIVDAFELKCAICDDTTDAKVYINKRFVFWEVSSIPDRSKIFTSPEEACIEAIYMLEPDEDKAAELVDMYKFSLLLN